MENAASSSCNCSWVNVVRCRLRAGVGGQEFTLEFVKEVGTVRVDPARPAIKDDGVDRWVNTGGGGGGGGSTFSFLKAVSVELLNTDGKKNNVVTILG